MRTKYRIALGLLMISSSIHLDAQDSPEPAGNPCDIMMTLAQDEERVSYLRQWFEEKVQDPEFLHLAGPSGRVRLLDTRERASAIDIDWGYLGLDPAYAYVELNRTRADYLRLNEDDVAPSEITDASKVKSVTIGYGRAGLVVGRGDNSFGIDWRPALTQAIETKRDDVLVFCR